MTLSSVNNNETCNLDLDNPCNDEITGDPVDIVAISECVESTYKNVEMDLGIFEDLDNNLMISLFDNVVVECEAINFVESLERMWKK